MNVPEFIGKQTIVSCDGIRVRLTEHHLPPEVEVNVTILEGPFAGNGFALSSPGLDTHGEVSRILEHVDRKVEALFANGSLISGPWTLTVPLEPYREFRLSGRDWPLRVIEIARPGIIMLVAKLQDGPYAGHEISLQTLGLDQPGELEFAMQAVRDFIENIDDLDFLPAGAPLPEVAPGRQTSP